jgi:hypothetical protein
MLGGSAQATLRAEAKVLRSGASIARAGGLLKTKWEEACAHADAAYAHDVL